MTKVSNVSRLPQIVPIILANGTKTSINVMPRARPELPEGAKVDRNWLALNPGCVKVFAPEVKKEPEPIDNKPAAEVKRIEGKK